MNVLRGLCLVILIFGATGRAEEVDYRLDDELFRRGLIDRGLDELLVIYNKDHPPQSDLDLLAAQISGVWLEYRRAQTSEAADTALTKLLSLELDRIEAYQDHPLLPNWRVRYARDLLNEKYGSSALVCLLDLTLPADKVEEFKTGLDQVEAHFAEAQRVLERKLAEFRTMADKDLEAVNRAGLPELYDAAGLQARYLRSWCLFYKLQISPEIGKSKIMTTLRDLLDGLADANLGDEEPGLIVLRAAAYRRLGSNSRAEELLAALPGQLEPSCRLPAEIERVELALKQGKGRQAQQLAERIDKSAFPDAYRQGLVMLKQQLLIARAKLTASSEDHLGQRAHREDIWSGLTNVVSDNIEWGPFIFERIDTLAGAIPDDELADIELYAKGYLARRRGSPQLTQTILKRLLDRPNVHPGLRSYAVRLLADSLADTRQFDVAVKLLRDETPAGSVRTQLDEERLTYAVALAWQGYEDQNDEVHRQTFIDVAGQLLAKYGQSKQANRFRLLLAEQLSQVGRFAEAERQLDQSASGSELIGESKATRIIVRCRQFARVREKGNDASVEMGQLAKSILTLADEMMSVVAAGQKHPESPETWQLSASQLNLIGNALLECLKVLSHPSAHLQNEAHARTEKFDALIKRFTQASPQALAVQISRFCEEFTEPALLRAEETADVLFDHSDVPVELKIQTSVLLSTTVHRHLLTFVADPIVHDPSLLARANQQQAEKAAGTLAVKASPQQKAQLEELFLIAMGDAGAYGQIKPRRAILAEPVAFKIDLDLILARAALANSDFPTASKIAENLLKSISPQDVRYWHVLIVSLTAHLNLKSAPSDIAAAVIARQEQFPQLGSDATRRQLMEILKIAQSRMAQAKPSGKSG